MKPILAILLCLLIATLSFGQTTNADVAKAIAKSFANSNVDGKPVNTDDLESDITFALDKKDEIARENENKLLAECVLLREQVSYNGQLALQYQKLYHAEKARHGVSAIDAFWIGLSSFGLGVLAGELEGRLQLIIKIPLQTR